MPIKWKKHLVLPIFGIRSMEDLESEIHRYNYKDIKLLVKDIYEDMEKDDGTRKMYTISLVKREQLHKLPNINVSNVDELLDFYKQNAANSQFQEVWFCKKQAKSNEVFSIGRISINTIEQYQHIYGLQTAHLIEQVWNTNHRAIEKYTDKADVAYLRASRIGWGRRYSVDKMELPKNSDDKTKYIQTVKEIENKREQIEYMSQYLRNLGINQFSLEYLLQRDKFLFIDWDSQDDLKVINSLIKEKEETIER